MKTLDLFFMVVSRAIVDDLLELHKDKNYLVQLSTYHGSEMTKKMKEYKRDIKTDWRGQ